MTRAGVSQTERCSQHQHTEVILTPLIHHMSVYLSSTYGSVQSDFRWACVCVYAHIHVCVIWFGKNNYIGDQHETAIGAACFHWPHINLNLIHTRRQNRTGGTSIHMDTHISDAHTQAHPSREQPPITLLCQLPQLSMINPFSMGGQGDCTDKGWAEYHSGGFNPPPRRIHTNLHKHTYAREDCLQGFAQGLTCSSTWNL